MAVRNSRSVPIGILYPRFDHPAIEERYASWQSQMLLRDGTHPIHFYDPSESSADAASEADEEHLLVVTDPLLLPPPHLATRLFDVLTSDADAVVPVTNESPNEFQRRPPPALYLTLRELQEAAAALQARPAATQRLTWDGSDPAVFLCRADVLARIKSPLPQALAGRIVILSENDYVHRWSSLRGQVREDLLARVSPDAKNILEFGCGEAPLGEALKRRQKCRVVGIELDHRAATIARRRIDDVYEGDVRTIVEILHDQFDWIIGGDIVEHLDEPWSFLAELRRIAAPGAHLLLSLPNLANASIVSDLTQGRFDYVYMGLTCVGHLRFFTRRTITEMLTIAGWSVVEILPQQYGVTAAGSALIETLEHAGTPFSKEDLLATGYYVVARNG